MSPTAEQKPRADEEISGMFHVIITSISGTEHQAHLKRLRLLLCRTGIQLFHNYPSQKFLYPMIHG